MSSTGLYLGKFEPLHKGHQHCIDVARERVDELVVMVYDTDASDIPLVKRREWLRELYPNVTVLKSWVGPKDTGYDDHTKAKHERHVLRKLESRGIDNIDVYFSSEKYGRHMAQALDAADFRVDMDRSMYPISGTSIRNRLNEGHYQAVEPWMDDVVYRDLVTNVVILGGTSTGKTTLARKLASEFSTEWMPEYGREYWEEHADENGELSAWHLYKLALQHIQREDERLTEAGEYLFTDTNPVTTGLFSQWYHGYTHSGLRDLMRDSIQRYDVVILCDDDIPYEHEEGRGGPEGRERLQRMHESWLNAHNVPYHRVSGSVEERVAQVSDVLESFNKYQPEQ